MIRLFLVPCYDSHSHNQTEDTRKYNTLETRCVGGMDADAEPTGKYLWRHQGANVLC